MASRISFKQLGNNDITPYIGGQVFLNVNEITDWRNDITISTSLVKLKNGNNLSKLHNENLKLIQIVDDDNNLVGIAIVKLYNAVTSEFTIRALEYGKGKFSIYKSTLILSTKIDDTKTLQFTDIITSGITIDDLEINQLVYDSEGTVARIISVDLVNNTFEIATMTTSTNPLIHKSDKELNKSVDGSTTLLLTDLAVPVTIDEIKVNQLVYDINGTVAKIDKMDITTNSFDTTTITVVSKEYAIYKSNIVLDDTVDNTTTLNLSDIVTTSTIDELKPGQLIYDIEGTIAKIDTINTTTNTFVATTITSSSNGVSVYKSNKNLDLVIDGTTIIPFTDLVTTGTINDIKVNQLVYDGFGTVGKIDSIDTTNNEITTTTITIAGSTGGSFSIFTSSLPLNKTIGGTTKLSQLDVSGTGVTPSLDINTLVYDSEGTVARVQSIDATTGDIETITMTISSDDFAIYYSVKDLDTDINDVTTLDFIDLITPMGTTINDLKLNRLVFDGKGTVAKIDLVDTVNNKLNVTTMTIAGNEDHMPIAPDVKEPSIQNGGLGYKLGDVIETTTSGVFVEVTNVDSNGIILDVAMSTSTTQSTSGTGAIIDYKQVVFGGYGSNWAALSDAAVLVAQTVVDKFDYETGYSFEIDTAGTGYAIGDIVATDVNGLNVRVKLVDTNGEILQVEYCRDTVVNTSGTGASIKATLDLNVFIIPDEYWNAGLALFYLTNNDGAGVQFYRNGDILVKYNAGASGQVYEFTFDEVNGIITQKTSTISGSSMKEYRSAKILNTIIEGSTLININDITPATPITGIMKEQLVYDIDGTVARVTNTDPATGNVTVQTITISGDANSNHMPIAPDTKEMKIKNPGSGYTVGDIIESTTTGEFAEVVAVDALGAITQVTLSTATAASATGTGAIISYEQVIYGGYNNNWAALVDASRLNAQVVADQSDYITGYSYTVNVSGTNYDIGEIVATDVPGVYAEVTSVGPNGEVLAVEYTRDVTVVAAGAGVSVTATPDPNFFIVPTDIWNSGATVFTITNDQGASTKFYRTGDILVKYGIGNGNQIFKFEYDEIKGTIRQTAIPLSSGNPIVYASPLPLNAMTMQKGTLYINESGFTFTPDGTQLVYSQHSVQFVTSLPTIGAQNMLYTNVTDKTLYIFDGTQFVKVGGGSSNIEFNTRANFPAIGDIKSLYIATDENIIYRFDGTDYVDISSTTGKQYSTTIVGDGVNNSFTINHAMNTTRLVTNVYDLTTGESVPFEQRILNPINIVISWGDPIPTGTTYQVDILGW